MNECPVCKTNLYPELFEQEIVCDCGTLLNVDWNEDGFGFNAVLKEVIK